MCNIQIYLVNTISNLINRPRDELVGCEKLLKLMSVNITLKQKLELMPKIQL